ncbi:c-type cytochrome [Ramlibacter alkalitolerans]|uniref:C-type cytochrome n=1 Tax=Ramlibacter alkalitolerans TaxID=2039631 RepID=A0ABS1JHG9_9BURK|nr:c-type cytochrome [Ramlibacter alkalitolerans]MBL0423670.1 c-type cytochrome [Ramlibacter alkalitolerans]
MHARLISRLPRVPLLALVAVAGLSLASCGGGDDEVDLSTVFPPTPPNPTLVGQGQPIFRFETFGDETFFTDVLQLNTVVETAVTPTVALGVGLKVDAEALPPAVVQGVQNGSISLTDPQTTLALIELDAVLGLKGQVTTDANGVKHLARLGVTCAICHSTVDNSFSTPAIPAGNIGKRLDGWPNRDLNVGAIVALSPALPAAVKAVYNSWGPGLYDDRFNIVDGGTPFHGDGVNKPAVIPPAYGLLGVNKTTFTGDGNDIAYWNRYVAVTQFGGHGTFTEPRLNLNVKNGTDDLVSSKLPALQAYQLSLEPPAPPAGSFDVAAAARGQALFNGKAQCSTCHSGPRFTDANERLHPQSDSMSLDTSTPTHADRSATKQYRTTPLRGIWQHPPYFHDGSAPTLDVVVARYNDRRSLGLSAAEMADLVNYLKSI